MGFGKRQEGQQCLCDSISMVAKHQQHNLWKQQSLLRMRALIQPHAAILPLNPQ